MKTNIKCVLFFCVLFFLPNLAFSAITFDGDGKWSTTFDCDDWESREPNYDYRLDCDGMVRSSSTGPLSGGEVTTLSSVSNYSSGAGGKGMRFWKGSGANFIRSGTVSVEFPSPQREIWVRWYARWESGFQWNNGMQGEKSLYFRDASATSQPYTGFYHGDWRMYHALITGGVDEGSNIRGTIGWDDVHGGATSDGTWHAYEVHIKHDTGSNDGVVQFWVDGVLNGSDTSISFGAGGASFPGWTNFYFLENQIDPGLSRAYYVDVDDMTVYNATPPNIDANGNAFIGTLDSTPVTSPPVTSPPVTSTCSDGIQNGDETGVDCGGSCVPCSSGPIDTVTGLTKGTLLFYESFEDDSWAGRGWYDGTSSTGTESGGFSGNALKLAWSNSATQPTGFSTIRNHLSLGTDEFLIEYYVKYDSGWQGSTPHLIHILSSDDGDWGGFASKNSNLYFESYANPGEGYTNYPVIAHQDTKRAVSAANNLTGVTETRSANHCDTPYTLTGATIGVCYDAGGEWYSQNIWRSSSASIPENEWVKITAHIKKNTYTSGVGNFDGVMKLWVNNALAIDKNNVLYAAWGYVGSTWDKIAIAPYIGNGSPIAQSMWLDELKIWSVSGGESSTIAPPSNLRIVQ